MPKLTTCLFCLINQNKLPSYTVAESEQVRVLLDIRPITRGHLMVITKHHCEYLHQLDNTAYSDLFQVVQQITQQISELFDDVTDCNLVINNGPHSGQHIQHVHVHIIPRRRFDSVAFYWRLFTRFINPFSRLNRAGNLQQLHKTLENKVQLTKESNNPKQNLTSLNN